MGGRGDEPEHGAVGGTPWCPGAFLAAQPMGRLTAHSGACGLAEEDALVGIVRSLCRSPKHLEWSCWTTALLPNGGRVLLSPPPSQPSRAGSQRNKLHGRRCPNSARWFLLSQGTFSELQAFSPLVPTWRGGPDPLSSRSVFLGLLTLNSSWQRSPGTGGIHLPGEGSVSLE